MTSGAQPSAAGHQKCFFSFLHAQPLATNSYLSACSTLKIRTDEPLLILQEQLSWLLLDFIRVINQNKAPSLLHWHLTISGDNITTGLDRSYRDLGFLLVLLVKSKEKNKPILFGTSTAAVIATRWCSMPLGIRSGFMLSLLLIFPPKILTKYYSSRLTDIIVVGS